MVAKKQRPTHPEGRALQYEDLDREGQRAARENWAELGNVKSRHAAAVTSAEASRDKPGAGAMYKTKQEHRLSSLAAVEPHLVDKPITKEAAAGARVKRVMQGRERARAEGGLGESDWYFNHHQLIAQAGQQHGFSPHAAITATTGLSPLNDPATERPAGAAAMKLVAEPHTVQITPALHKKIKPVITRMKGPPLPKEQVGQEVKVEDLHHTHVAAIGAVNAQMRNAGKPVQSSAPEAFTSMGATRLSDEIGKSIGHLRGEIPEKDVISHTGAPKVHSYKEVTKMSVPNSPEHLEFATRMHHFIHGDPNQNVMDLTGLRHSQKGPLSSEGPTAEDTWQQAISTRQTPLNVPGTTGRGVSVSKMAGSDKNLGAVDAIRKTAPSGATLPPDPKISGQSAGHAMNNKATRMAANRIKIRMGDDTTHMPATAVQAMGWTEERRQADKDPQYKEAQKARLAPAVSDRQFDAQAIAGHRQAARKERGEPALRKPKQTQLKFGGM